VALQPAFHDDYVKDRRLADRNGAALIGYSSDRLTMRVVVGLSLLRFFLRLRQPQIDKLPSVFGYDKDTSLSEDADLRPMQQLSEASNSTSLSPFNPCLNKGIEESRRGNPAVAQFSETTSGGTHSPTAVLPVLSSHLRLVGSHPIFGVFSYK
jgi:hypothetical protein